MPLKTLMTYDFLKAASMATSSTIIRISPVTDGTQSAVSAWLDLITRSVQTGSRKADPVTKDSQENRARILQQAATIMLAPVQRQPRVLGDLLR